VALPKIPASVIVICILFAVIGGLWGSHAAGLINLTPVLSDLPVIGNYFIDEVQIDTNSISPLEIENKKLKERISKLGNELTNSQANETNYKEEINKLQNELSSLEAQIKMLQDQEKNALKLAEYYGQMKPKEVVPIFDNLDDDTVLSILTKMESSQTAKILAELEPLRAAKLTKVLTDINNNATDN